MGDEEEFEQQLPAASPHEEQEPLLLLQQQQQRRSWADGDSSDEDEALDQVTTLRRISNAAAGFGSGAGGAGNKPGSRRATAANAPAVTTAEEARKASRAGKKLPSTKLQELLAHSNEQIAVFLRETYDVTANFVSDEVDLEVMQRQYKRWQRAKAPAAAAAAGLSNAGGVLSRAGGAGGLPGPEASTAALQQLQQGPRLAASLAGAGLMPAEASTLAMQMAAAAAAAAAGLPAVPAAAKRPLSGEEVAVFGFKFVQQPEHTMFGVLVDQQVRDTAADCLMMQSCLKHKPFGRGAAYHSCCAVHISESKNQVSFCTLRTDLRQWAAATACGISE
jgi:hypothetical protein